MAEFGAAGEEKAGKVIEEINHSMASELSLMIQFLFQGVNTLKIFLSQRIFEIMREGKP